jgi:hypothetical protein
MTVPVRSDGDLIEGVVITVNDITELRRLEQMRKDFVANVSHELRTPITAIAGFAHALQEGAKENPGELEHFLAIITRQARNMQRIVEDLLLLSSLEQQQASPVKSWIAVEQLLAETVESCRFRAEERHTTILTGIEDPAHLDVFVNGSLMVQALGNLVVNAITYSDEHSSVRLEAKVEEQYVTFTVSDTGQGIPKEALQRIFEPSIGWMRRAAATREEQDSACRSSSISCRSMEEPSRLRVSSARAAPSRSHLSPQHQGDGRVEDPQRRTLLFLHVSIIGVRRSCVARSVEAWPLPLVHVDDPTADGGHVISEALHLLGEIEEIEQPFHLPGPVVAWRTDPC